VRYATIYWKISTRTLSATCQGCSAPLDSPDLQSHLQQRNNCGQRTRKQRFPEYSTRVLLVQTHDRDTLPRPPHEEGTQGDTLPIAGAMSSARRGGRGRGGGVNIANASTSDALSGPRNGARGRGNINRANTRATSRGITRGPRGGGGGGRGGGRDTQTQSRGGRATPPPSNSARENGFGSANNATPIVQDGSLSSRFAMVCSPLSPFFSLYSPTWKR